jgi:hypothetical protein
VVAIESMATLLEPMARARSVVFVAVLAITGISLELITEIPYP